MIAKIKSEKGLAQLLSAIRHIARRSGRPCGSLSESRSQTSGLSPGSLCIGEALVVVSGREVALLGLLSCPQKGLVRLSLRLQVRLISHRGQASHLIDRVSRSGRPRR